jgi:hypothetical protein
VHGFVPLLIWARAQVRWPFSDSVGLFNSWYNVSDEMDYFVRKNPTFPSFVCFIVPHICSRVHVFVPLLIFGRFFCSFVPHDLFPSAYFCSLLIFGRFRRSIVPHDLFLFAWFCSSVVLLKSGNKN